MNYQIVILESAEQDLIELHQYISKNFSIAVWKDTYGKLKKAIRRLKKFPFSGSIPEEASHLGFSQFRQLISGMNRVIYEVRLKVIYIHIIADTRREMSSLLMKRLLVPRLNS